MLRRLFCAGVALLLVVGVTLAEDKKNEGKRPRNVAFGKVVSLVVNGDGSGTLVVVSTPRDGGEAKEHKFKVTDKTKYVMGGGRGKEGTPVEADQVRKTFHEGAVVAVRYE